MLDPAWGRRRLRARAQGPLDMAKPPPRGPAGREAKSGRGGQSGQSAGVLAGLCAARRHAHSRSGSLWDARTSASGVHAGRKGGVSGASCGPTTRVPRPPQATLVPLVRPCERPEGGSGPGRRINTVQARRAGPNSLPAAPTRPPHSARTHVELTSGLRGSAARPWDWEKEARRSFNVSCLLAKSCSTELPWSRNNVRAGRGGR